MAFPTPRPPLKPRIPPWERRLQPDRWRWKGRRSTDPSLGSWKALGFPRSTLAWGFASGLLALLLIFLFTF